MPVFLISQPADDQGCFSIDSQDLHHLTRVLRTKRDESFEVLFADQSRALARLEQHPNGYQGRVTRWLSKKPDALDSPFPLWLGVGMIRWPRMEWLVEKATELRVGRLSPLLLKHSRFDRQSDYSAKIARLKKISQETLKQCERTTSLEIDAPMSLNEFIEKTSRPAPVTVCRQLFNEKIRQPLLNVSSWKRSARFCFLFGPEGGFSAEEVQRAEAAGFESLSLGPWIFRAETAALYTTAQLHSFMGNAANTETKPSCQINTESLG